MNSRDYTVFLKAPSGQIGYAWEWYHCHWIGLEKDINRYRGTFICWKNPPKGCTILVWIAGCWNSSNILPTSGNPKNNCWLSGIFGALFGGKKYHSFCPYKMWSKQAGGWIHFCMKWLRILKSFQIFKTEIKKLTGGKSVVIACANLKNASL